MLCSFHIYYEVQDNNVKISFSEKKREYNEWKILKTFSFAHIVSNPVIQMENSHTIQLSNVFIPELNKLTNLSWTLINNEYHTSSSLEVWNKLKTKMNDNQSSPLNIKNILFGIIRKTVMMSTQQIRIPLSPIVNYSTLGYIYDLCVITHETGKLDVCVKFVGTIAGVALFSLIINDDENKQINVIHEKTIHVNSKLINNVIFIDIYDIKYLDLNMFEQILSIALQKTKSLAFSLYTIITLSNKLFSSSLFDIRSASKITIDANLYNKYVYYRMFHLYENPNLKVSITQKYVDDVVIIPITSQICLKCWCPTEFDMIAKMFMTACGIDNIYNKFNEPILEYNDSTLPSLSKNNCYDDFQKGYYQWLKLNKKWKVYNEGYNDIDIMSSSERTDMIDYFKSFLSKNKDQQSDQPLISNFAKNIQLIINWLLFESIKYSPDHMFSIECKNYSGKGKFDVSHFKRALEQKYYPSCQLHLIVNCQTSNNIEQLEKDLIEYIKKFNVNVKIVIKFIDNYKYDVNLKYITIKPN